MATFKDRLEVVLSLSDKMSSPLRKVTNGVTKFASSVSRRLFSVRTAIVGLGAALTVGALGNFTAFAGQVETISTSFDSLAESAGQSSEKILAAMQKASEGTIDRLNLMKLANNALLTGIAKTPEEFERIVETSLKLGRALGIDATEAYEKLSIALARQSKLRLDDFGLIIDAEVANKKYAASIGKTVDQLTDQEKAQAFVTESYDIADRALEALGGQTANVSRAYEQFLVALKDTRTEIADALAPVLTDFFTRLANFVRTNKPLILGFFADTTEGFGEFTARTSEFVAVLTRQLGNLENFVKRLQVVQLEVQIRAREFSESLRESPVGGFFSAVGQAFAELDENARGSLKSLAEIKAETEALRREQSALVADIFEGSEERAAAIERSVAAIREASAAAAQKLREQAEAQRRVLEDLGRTSAVQFALDVRAEDAENLFRARDAIASFGAETAAATAGFDRFLASVSVSRSQLTDVASGFTDVDQAVRRSEDSLANLQTRMPTFLDGARQGLRGLSLEWSNTFELGRRAAVDTGNALTSNLTNGLTAVITRTQSLKEAFARTAAAILQDIARIIVRLLIVKFIESTLSSFGGGGGASIGSQVANFAFGQIGSALQPDTPNIGALGSYQGGGLVPETGLYQLHAGERVTPAETTRAIDAAQGRGGGRTVVFEQTIQVFAQDAESFDDKVMRAIASRTEEVARAAMSGYQNDPAIRAGYGAR